MKTVQVQEVLNILQGSSCALVSEDDPLEIAIKRFVEKTQCGAVFVLDSQRHLAGIITRDTLLKWAQFHLGGSGGIHLSIAELFRYINSVKSKDLSFDDWHNIRVSPTDNLEIALKRMITHEVDYIPVTDKEGNIVGILGLSHILLKVLEMGKEASR